MAYTYKQLSMAYAAVHGGIEPTGEVASQLLLMTNVSYTDAQRLSYILNGADQTTAVAVLSYQFFTGKAPTAEGLAYLVNSTANPTNLNSDVYAKFNLENRFMNFATNLALQGEAKAKFEGQYGSMTYAQYVASIYDSIIGKAQATAAGLNPDAIIADIIARQDLILLSARNNGVIGPNATQAEIDLALKAATAAYLLAEGIKADVGVYAGATNNFMLNMATGKAAYGTDILATHAPVAGSASTGVGQAVDNPPPLEDLPGLPPAPQPEQPSNQTFTLTAGADKFKGAAGDDTFNGTAAHFDYGDELDGGAGEDTLTITSTGGQRVDSLPNNGVSNIETYNLNTDGEVFSNTYGWTGLKQVNVTSVGETSVSTRDDVNIKATVTNQGSGHITVYEGHDVTVEATGATMGRIEIGTSTAITGDVVVSRELAGVSGNDINITGGKTVSVTQTVIAAPGQSHGTVTVNGSELTTAVTVKATAPTGSLTANSVSINDTHGGGSKLSGTISQVSVDSYSTFAFSGTGLNDLSLAHGSGDVTLINDSLGLASPVTTLKLALNGLTGGTLEDEGAYTTVNVTTGTENSTLANVKFGALETLTIAGDSRLTLTATSGLAQLETVTITGNAGLSANLSGATVTSVDASGTTGNNTLTIDAKNATFKGGAGDDHLTLVSGVTHADLTDVISGGAGDNTLVINATDAAQISGQPTAKFSGFQTIELTGAAAQTIDMGQLEGTATTIRTAGATGAGLTLTNATAVETLELTDGGTAYNLSGNWAGTSDVLALKLNNTAAANRDFASTGVTATGVETINITSTANTGSIINTVKLLGNDLKAVTVSGETDVVLTTGGNALTGVDASSLTGDFTFTSAGLVSAISITGTTAGTNIVNLAAVNNGVTYVGGSGSDTITVAAGKNTIDLGSGADHVTFTRAPSPVTTNYAVITGFGTDDTLTFNMAGGPGAPTSLVKLTGQATLEDYLAYAVGGDGDAAGDTRMQWFELNGDTYLVQDRSGQAFVGDGVDMLVKLVGVTDLSGWTVSGGTLSF
jgi:S-layer protein